MIPSKKILGFIVLVVLVVAYAVFDFQNEKSIEKAKLEQSMLFVGKVDQVKSIQFDLVAQPFKMDRTVDGWKSDLYKNEVLDEESVTQFLEGIATEKSMMSLLSGEKIDWAVYSLDKPKAKITLTDNAGVIQAFEISGKKNFQGDVYLKKQGEEKVFVVSSVWQQKAEKEIDDFRDRRWARLEAAKIDGIYFKKGSENIHLQKLDDNWQLIKSTSIKLDQNKVRKLIANFTSNRLQKFLPNLDSGPKQINKGLIEVEFLFKDKQIWQGFINLSSEKKYVLSVPAVQIRGEISPDDASELFKISLDALRDRNEPFRFAKEEVKKIEWKPLIGKGFEANLKDDTWEAVPPAQVDSAKIKGLLNKLVALEASQFLPDGGKNSQPKKANSTLNQLVLKTTEGKVYFEFNWGAINGNVVEAQTSLLNAAFYVESDKVKDLGLEQIMIEKNNESSQTK